MSVPERVATKRQGRVWSREEKAAAQEEVCSVRVGESLFGVPIRPIFEIVASVRPLPVPLAPSFIGGLVHYRGDVLATVDLRHLLGLPPATGPQDVLVMGGQGGNFGLLVDAVGEVLTVSKADHEPNPAILDERYRTLLAGAYKLKGNLLVMLDPEQLDPLRLRSGPATQPPERLGGQ
jgi:purine-binding chemotaxis protein CheW